MTNEQDNKPEMTAEEWLKIKVDTYGHLMDLESYYEHNKMSAESWRDSNENSDPTEAKQQLKEIKARLRNIRKCMKWVKLQQTHATDGK
jgi:hypothetical protein